MKAHSVWTITLSLVLTSNSHSLLLLFWSTIRYSLEASRKGFLGKVGSSPVNFTHMTWMESATLIPLCSSQDLDFQWVPLVPSYSLWEVNLGTIGVIPHSLTYTTCLKINGLVFHTIAKNNRGLLQTVCWTVIRLTTSKQCAEKTLWEHLSFRSATILLGKPYTLFFKWSFPKWSHLLSEAEFISTLETATWDKWFKWPKI